MTRGEGGWLFLPSAGLSPAILRQLAWRTSPTPPNLENPRKRVEDLPAASPEASGDGGGVAGRRSVARLVEQIREQNSLWYSIGHHAGAFVVAKMPVNTAFLPYGGSCVSTWIGPLVHDPG